MLKMNCTAIKPKRFATYRCSEREKTQCFNPIKRRRPNLHGSKICPDACQRGLRVCLKTESKLATIKDQNLIKNIRLKKTCFPISNICLRPAVTYHCESRLSSSVYMIVYSNLYNKVLKRKLKRTGKSKTKTCLTAVSIVTGKTFVIVIASFC